MPQQNIARTTTIVKLNHQPLARSSRADRSGSCPTRSSTAPSTSSPTTCARRLAPPPPPLVYGKASHREGATSSAAGSKTPNNPPRAPAASCGRSKKWIKASAAPAAGRVACTGRTKRRARGSRRCGGGRLVLAGGRPLAVPRAPRGFDVGGEISILSPELRNSLSPELPVPELPCPRNSRRLVEAG